MAVSSQTHYLLFQHSFLPFFVNSLQMPHSVQNQLGHEWIWRGYLCWGYSGCQSREQQNQPGKEGRVSYQISKKEFKMFYQQDKSSIRSVFRQGVGLHVNVLQFYKRGFRLRQAESYLGGSISNNNQVDWMLPKDQAPKTKVARVINWLGKTEGRDKMCKLIQYGAKIIKYHAQSRDNYELGMKCEGLSQGIRNARKIFRLFKSIYEYENIVRLLWEKIPLVDKILRIVSRIFYLLYWIFDNIAVLSIVRLWRYDVQKYIRLGFLFWFLGLCVYLLATIKSLLFTLSEIKKVRQEPANESKYPRYTELLQKRKKYILMIIKTVGDLFPSSSGCGIFEKIFKMEASDALIGWGGFISAIISNYQLFD